MSKKFRCILGFHRNKRIGTQSVHGILYDMCPPMRDINRCEDCGEITFFYYDISFNGRDDLSLDWQPKT